MNDKVDLIAIHDVPAYYKRLRNIRGRVTFDPRKLYVLYAKNHERLCRHLNEQLMQLHKHCARIS
jgi:hypothetical protein